MVSFSARSALPFISLLALAGCSAAIASEDPSQIQSALEAPNGGLNAQPEQPAFADPAVEAVQGFAPGTGDATDMTESVAQTAGLQRFHVAVVWGHLPPAHDADDTDLAPRIMDWTGGVSVDNGALGLRRTIAFDPGDRVLPRQSPQEIDFVSHTLPHVDGLYMAVAIPANASPTIHFKTKSLTTDIDLSVLAKQPGGAVRLDDGRNGMFFVGFPDDGCARGLLVGRWRKVRPALGELRGVVVGAEGDAIGHVRGIWGHAPRRNANVFFGKYIALGGEYRGLFGGVYGDGRFGGVWGEVDPNLDGTLEGVYSDGYERGDGRGVFLGRWAEKCPR